MTLPRIWSASAALEYISCPRQWAVRHGVLSTLSPRKPGARSKSAPMSSRLGTLAHVGMQAAYTAASMAQWHVGDASMTPYVQNALISMKGAAIDLDVSDADVAEVEDDVIYSLRALPAPTRGSILSVERESVVRLPSSRLFRGVIDLKMVTGVKTVHVRDWKRKKIEKLPKPVELLDDLPMAMYAYMVYQELPDVEVTVGLYSLRSQREVFLPMPYAAALAMAQKVDELIVKAESDTELVPTPRGGNCQRCLVANSCPVWSGNVRNLDA